MFDLFCKNTNYQTNNLCHFGVIYGEVTEKSAEIRKNAYFCN